jgi:hypothetical protein
MTRLSVKVTGEALSILSASWVLFSASAVYADTILAVDMSNVTFQALAGNSSCSGAPCTETFNITFQWDNTTTTLVPGTLSVGGTGALPASELVGPWISGPALYGPTSKLGVLFSNNSATDGILIFDSDFVFPFVPGVYPYSDASMECLAGFSPCDKLLDFDSGGTTFEPLPISGTVTISATCSPTAGCPAPVPVPNVGAGVPGILFAGGGLLAWWRRKRKAQTAVA